MVIKTVFFDLNDTLYVIPKFARAQSQKPMYQLVKGISYDAAHTLFQQTCWRSDF